MEEIVKRHNIFHSIIKKTIAILIGIFIAIFIMLAALAITLNIKPLDVTPYLKHFQQYLKVGENDIFIQKASISYKGSLQLYLDNITLKTPERALLSEVKHVHAAFSNHSLAFGKIVVKHAYLKGLNLQLEISEEGIEIAAIKLKKKREKPFDIVKLLNENDVLSLKYLKTLEIDSSIIQTTDLINGDMWLMQNIKGELEKSVNRGSQLVLNTNVQRSGEDISMPVTLKFNHLPKAEYADISLNIAHADSKLIAKYMPEKIQNLLTGEGTLQVGAKIVQNKGLVAPYFQADLVKGAFTIDGIYGFPLPFDNLYIKGDYSRVGGHKLSIKEFIFTDEKGYTLEGKGLISNLKNDPYLDLLLTSKSMPLRHFNRYLPDQKIGSTTMWIEHNILQAIGTNIRVSYTGAISTFPCKEIGCGFDGSFDYKDLTLRFMDGVTPATDLDGKFIIRDGGIIIQSKKGKISNQDVIDITVDISNLFNRDKEKVVTVIAKASGEIQGTLDRISEKVGDGWLAGKVSGKHKSNVRVVIPLKKNITFDDVDFIVDSKLFNASYDVPVGKNKLNFKANEGDLYINDKILKLNAIGDLAGVLVEANWQENLRVPGVETKIDIHGSIQDDKLNPLISNFIPLESVGSTPFKLNLFKIETDVYDYELISDFKDSALIIPILNWEKVDKSSMNLVARGRVEVNGELFAVDSLTVTGDDVEIAGSMYVDKKGEMSLILSPFKLGETNITATMDGKKINFAGGYLDISGYDMLEDKNPNAKEDKMDIVFDINVDKLKMHGGLLTQVDIAAERVKNKWQKFIFKGFTSSGSNIDVNLVKRDDNKRYLKAVTTDAGEALKTLGLYKNIHKGYLTLDWYLDEGENRDKSSGILKITNTSIKDFPILAKLLSFLSLEQLFKSGNGILFDDVYFPLTMENDIVTINKAILEGPSIGMRFSGDIHTSNNGNNKLDIEGSLIPVSGLNKIVSNIPLVGDIITGSQDGLIVADFKVRGGYDNPDVSINPLSIVTPGLLKDIFGAITGKKKK